MASKTLQFYKCGVCGSEMAVVRGGGGTLVCCNQPMNLQNENTTDAAQEKHVPVVEKGDGRITVKVGEVAHPMQAEHWIEWIELLVDGGSYRQWLNPGDAPEAVFTVDADQFTVRAFCNLHGLWKSG